MNKLESKKYKTQHRFDVAQFIYIITYRQLHVECLLGTWRASVPSQSHDDITPRHTHTRHRSMTQSSWGQRKQYLQHGSVVLTLMIKLLHENLTNKITYFSNHVKLFFSHFVAMVLANHKTVKEEHLTYLSLGNRFLIQAKLTQVHI